MAEFMTEDDVNWIFEQAFSTRKLVTLGNKHFTAAEFKMHYLNGNRNIKQSDIKFTDPFELVRLGKEKLYDLMSRQLLFEQKIDGYMKGHIR
ncbi:hypothetical protein SAMN05192529_13137 [Arachidicoccus rhizosphaerae]|uniref:Uncharacterized protein n=1 Tax=Arachidicoccus rhizosphaerae TaxID=551991 RepID=A0A1H4CFZ4_9BACT|nr:hypothetical protein [Arachidicoccus rhizosphaerae]SEA59321.1 hypothetical protein SAMN05192529_13137 [Arachidicoccus rhizosphaerae]